MSRLDDLLKSPVNIREIMSQETEKRFDKTVESFTPSLSNSNDFHEEEHEEEIIEEYVDEKTIREEQAYEEPYDAEKNARSIVYGLQALDSLILVPIATIKVKNSAGGKAVIKKMREAYVKQMSGEKLDEHEERLIKSFAVYKRDLDMLADDFIPNQKKTEELIRLAIPWCEENKIKFNSGFGFWAAYSGHKVEQITKILLK